MAFTKITAAGIDTSGTVTTESISVSGVSTVGSLSIGNTSVISAGRQLQNIVSLDATTTATIESAVANAPNTFSDLNVSGISTLGVTSTTNLTSQQLNVSGVATATTFIGALTGTASNVTTNANLTGHVTSVGNAAVLGSFTSLQLLTALTDETGSGANVFATSPTLVTPALGTPSSGTLTNCTFPTLNQNTTGNSATVTTNANLTGHVTSVGNAAVLGSFTSAQLATALTDETGSGANVFATSPTLVTPALGTPSSGTLTNCTFPTLNQNTTGSSASCSGNSATATTATNQSGGTVSATTGTFSSYVTASTGVALDPANITAFGAGQITATTGFSAPGMAFGSGAGSHGAIVYGSGSMYFGSETGTTNTMATRMTLSNTGNLSVTGTINSSGKATLGGANNGSGSNAALLVNGDVCAYRASNTGVYYFGSGTSGSIYLYYDGTNFNFSGGNVFAPTFSGSGASLTSLTAGNLSGTIPSGVLGNSTHYIGTTAIALNRASASQSLTGINIDGSSASAPFDGLTSKASGSGTYTTSGDFRAPLFYDSQNTAYYLDPNSTSNLYHLVLSGASYFRPSNWIQMDGSYGMYWPNTNGAHLEGNTLSSYGSIAIRGSRNGWRGIHFYEGGNTPHLMFTNANGGFYFETGDRWASYYSYSNNCWGFGTSSTSSAYNIYCPTGVYSGGRVDGTIFYDSNNTAYYTDPASTSILNNLTLNGSLTVGSSTSSDIYMTDTDEGTRRIHCNSNRIGFLNQDANWGAYCSDTGDWTTDYISYAGASHRSPIFYDYNNTGYYTDPASTSNLNALTANSTFTVNNGWSYVANNYGYGIVGLYHASYFQLVFAMGDAYKTTAGGGINNLYGIAWSHPNAGGIAANLNDHGMLVALNGTFAAAISSSIRCATDMRAPLFYDSNNTGYYTDPASTSNLNNVQVVTFGVGTAASGTTGEIRATNNVTAYYSDERLKENITTISSALSKLLTLRGVTFNSNEIAEQYGYTDKKEQVGVIAQDVEKVLPQVVVPAPFDIAQDKDGNEYSKSGENYKTVHYDKLVPLLIEAIKELKREIEELESKIPV